MWNPRFSVEQLLRSRRLCAAAALISAAFVVICCFSLASHIKCRLDSDDDRRDRAAAPQSDAPLHSPAPGAPRMSVASGVEGAGEPDRSDAKLIEVRAIRRSGAPASGVRVVYWNNDECGPASITDANGSAWIDAGSSGSRGSLLVLAPALLPFQMLLEGMPEQVVLTVPDAVDVPISIGVECPSRGRGVARIADGASAVLHVLTDEQRRCIGAAPMPTFEIDLQRGGEYLIEGVADEWHGALYVDPSLELLDGTGNAPLYAGSRCSLVATAKRRITGVFVTESRVVPPASVNYIYSLECEDGSVSGSGVSGVGGGFCIPYGCGRPVSITIIGRSVSGQEYGVLSMAFHGGADRLDVGIVALGPQTGLSVQVCDDQTGAPIVSSKVACCRGDVSLRRFGDVGVDGNGVARVACPPGGRVWAYALGYLPACLEHGGGTVSGVPLSVCLLRASMLTISLLHSDWAGLGGDLRLMIEADGPLVSGEGCALARSQSGHVETGALAVSPCGPPEWAIRVGATKPEKYTCTSGVNGTILSVKAEYRLRADASGRSSVVITPAVPGVRVRLSIRDVVSGSAVELDDPRFGEVSNEWSLWEIAR